LKDTLSLKKAGPLRGEIRVPGDKSISHRALILSAISEGKGRIKNLLSSEDVGRTLRAFQDMGVRIKAKKSEVKVNGLGLDGLKAPASSLYMGNSGTAMRLLAGLLAGQKFSSKLTGDESLSKRPMRRIMEPLGKMGAEISGTEQGTAPLLIHGRPLKGIRYEMPVASAQVKSCILLAALYAKGLTEVIEPLKSRDHTERMLRSFGVDLEQSENTIRLEGRQRLAATDIEVPGDISSAGFFIVAGLLVPGSNIVIRGVGINPTRTGLLEILESMGARIALENQASLGDEPTADIVVQTSRLHGVKIGKDLIPRAIDEIPVLCVAAALAEGLTEISGAGELRVKETDRIGSLVLELKKFGIRIEEKADGMIIEGVEKLAGARVQSHGDHRLAMALSVAGLMAEGETEVKGTSWINTSFPGFPEIFKQLLA
jgi:3-phosphoshikimate 1-carboxyvinyltransferase